MATTSICGQLRAAVRAGDGLIPGDFEHPEELALLQAFFTSQR
jgi:hypothetical protein